MTFLVLRLRMRGMFLTFVSLYTLHSISELGLLIRRDRVGCLRTNRHRSFHAVGGGGGRLWLRMLYWGKRFWFSRFVWSFQGCLTCLSQLEAFARIGLRGHRLLLSSELMDRRYKTLWLLTGCLFGFEIVVCWGWFAKPAWVSRFSCFQLGSWVSIAHFIT